MTLGLVSFLVTALYWPGIIGAAITPRWALLSIAIPLLFPARMTVTPAHRALAAFVLWMGLTMLWSPAWQHSVPAMWFLALTAGAFCIGSETEDMRPVYIGAALGLSLSGAAAIAQTFFGWDGVAQVSAPAGLFVNRNVMVETAVLVCLGLVVYRLWWYLPLVMPAIILAHQRGPILALVIGLAVWSRSRVAAVALLLAIGAGVAVHNNTGWRSESITERIEIWADTWDGVTPLGRGIGSYYTLFPIHASRTNTLASRPDNVHNDLLEVLYEGGVPGLLLFCAFGALILRRRRRETPVFVAFGVMAMVSFPMHMASTAFLVAMVAGRLCRGGAGVHAHVDGRGTALRLGAEAQDHKQV